MHDIVDIELIFTGVVFHVGSLRARRNIGYPGITLRPFVTGQPRNVEISIGIVFGSGRSAGKCITLSSGRLFSQMKTCGHRIGSHKYGTQRG